MNFEIKATSQLPRIPDNVNIPQESLVEVCVLSATPNKNNKYFSRGVTLERLFKDVNSGLREEIEESFQLKDNDKDISVLDIKNRVDEIELEDSTFKGRKTFQYDVSTRSQSTVGDLEDNDFVTKKNAIDIARNSGLYISPDTTYVNMNPENTTPNTMFDDRYFMRWRFDHEGRDSSQFMVDPYSNQKAEPVFAKYDGNLVAYGWLADNGDVKAQEAWVGLFGLVTIGESDSQRKEWVALQIQPWIIGSKSQQLQYVGFNVPVKKNLQLKIMTGFPVNTRNSGFQNPEYNTLTFQTNQPCAFVGYILRNS